MQVLQSVFIACIQTVASVHLKFALCHLLGLFNLILRQLDRCWLVWLLLLLIRTCSLCLLVLMVRSLLLIIGGLLGSCLLCNLTFHKIDRVFFKFLTNLLLFALPLIFKSVSTVPLVFSDYTDSLLLVTTILGHELQVE